MSSGRSIITLTIALTLGAGTLAAQRRPAVFPVSVGDLTAAQLIEVRDLDGQVVLNGTLKTSSNKVNEIERKADLDSPTGGKADGKISIEIERKESRVLVETSDEIEFSASHLPAMAQFELFIDRRPVASFMTTKDGKGQVKLERKSTGG